MNGVTQQTAANAEESASASEELNAQAQQMKHYVADLSAVVSGVKSAQPIQETECADRKQLTSVNKPKFKNQKALAALPLKQVKS